MAHKNKAKRITAGELREALKEVPANTPIVLSSDPEGNEFYYIWEGESLRYDPDEKRLYIFPIEHAEEPQV